MIKFATDSKIIVSYVLTLSCGILVGYDLSSDVNNFSNIPAWLGSIGTLLAVIVALYTTKINLDRDKYDLDAW